MPIYNPAGKYLVKLHFNGVARKIVVDDRLPVSRGGELMCSHSTHREELWVSLIEKAYLKVMGGYDFPGGNSGIDMFALTGWIPEQFRTDAADFNAQRLWERMVSATKYGDCLITVATGDMSEAEGERLGLVPTHAYAVLQVREVGGVRLLQLKNPWARVRWKGSYSAHDTQRWTAALRAELQYEPAQALQMDNGIFWIDYGNLLKHYRGVYSNWNPALFRHHSSTHGQWPKRAAANANDSKNIGGNPQYGLRLSVSAEQVGAGRSAAVWLLLSRHTQRGASATHGEEGKDDYLTVHLFKARGGYRVFYLETCWRQGVYSNTPHCLVKFELEEGDHNLTLALAQYQPVDHQVDYTLDVYSMVPFGLRPLPFRMRHTERLTGAWRGASAGGCPNFDTYVDNPRFRLSAAAEVDVLVELEAAKGHDAVAVGLHLVPEEGGDAKPLKLSSGDYRGGFCMLEARSLPAGRYVLTASTFEPAKELGFELRVSSSSAPLGVAPLPHEAAGLRRQLLKGEWSRAAGTAAGSPNHGEFHRNPQYRLTLSRPAEVSWELARLRVGRRGGLAHVSCAAPPVSAPAARPSSPPHLLPTSLLPPHLLPSPSSSLPSTLLTSSLHPPPSSAAPPSTSPSTATRPSASSGVAAAPLRPPRAPSGAPLAAPRPLRTLGPAGRQHRAPLARTCHLVRRSLQLPRRGSARAARHARGGRVRVRALDLRQVGWGVRAHCVRTGGCGAHREGARLKAAIVHFKV